MNTRRPLIVLRALTRSYREGAVRVLGAGRPLGRGYAELTGYDPGRRHSVTLR